MEDTDAVVAMAAAVDLVAGCLRMCWAGFSLPTVMVSNQHRLPMVAAFVPEAETMGDINEAIPSLPGISHPVLSTVDSHKTQHSTVPGPMLLDMHMSISSRGQTW